jgi:hypothetical protein
MAEAGDRRCSWDLVLLAGCYHDFVDAYAGEMSAAKTTCKVGKNSGK